MPHLELPHTAGCFVCGRANQLGLRLSSFVDTATGNIHTTFNAEQHHIGFDNILHGGILATVLDEIMVWTAMWACGKACVAAELSLRFVQKAVPGMELEAIGKVARNRSRIIETTGEIIAADGLICTATAKYMPVNSGDSNAFFQTLIREPATHAAFEAFFHRSLPPDSHVHP
jgi:uncharacterized protein (TIGR00369 family)